MSNYYKTEIHILPYSEDAADLLAAFLAEEGYEAFESLHDDSQSTIGISAYVKEEDYNQDILEDTLKNFPIEIKTNFHTSLIPHQDWNEEWEKNYFKPMSLAGGRCVVHASFHKEYPPSEIEVIVDPKMAFGTGSHATTGMMVEFIFELDLRDKRIIDMGTGTGILAIIAKKLGAGETIGIEIDPSAYENALENVALNHTDILLLQGDADLLDNIKKADIFMANINRNIILADIDKYIEALNPGGQILLSGFYLKDIPMIQRALENYGMKVEEILKKVIPPSDPTSVNDIWAAVRASL